MRPRSQFFLAAFFVILVIVGLFWFSFFFLLDRVRAESAEIETAKISRVSLEARRNDVKREEVLFTELQTDVKRVEEAFVSSPLSLFEFLEDLARRNNLTITLAINGGDAERLDRLDVTVSGSYRNISSFTRGIESAPYAMGMQAITLQTINQAPVFADSVVRLTITLGIISE